MFDIIELFSLQDYITVWDLGNKYLLQSLRDLLPIFSLIPTRNCLNGLVVCLRSMQESKLHRAHSPVWKLNREACWWVGLCSLNMEGLALDPCTSLHIPAERGCGEFSLHTTVCTTRHQPYSKLPPVESALIRITSFTFSMAETRPWVSHDGRQSHRNTKRFISK